MPTQPSTTLPNASEWVDIYGDPLFRYALSRVNDPQAAEDLVQETFVAALAGMSRFHGKSSFLTWLIGILRRKIVDFHRREGRERIAVEAESDDEFDRLFYDHRGHWRRRVEKWPSNPAAALESQEFLQVLEDCMAQLTPGLSDAFQLREIEALEMPEICQTLGINRTTLSVRLHRARSMLRRCLELKWFKA